MGNGDPIVRLEFSSSLDMLDVVAVLSDQVGRMVGLELPVKVWRHSTAFLRLPPGLPADFPAVFDDANGLYFRPEGSSSMLAGLKDESETGGPADRETMTVPSGFGERVTERILTRCPSMAAGTFGAAHSGQDGITPDQKAIIGQVGPDGFYAACGFSGTGFKTAPAVGAAPHAAATTAVGESLGPIAAR